MPDYKNEGLPEKGPDVKGATALLTGSILAFIYLGWLVAQSYGVGVPGSSLQIFRIIGEMITIPLLIFVFVALFLSGSRIAKKHRGWRTRTTFILSLLTIVLMIVVTLLQI